MDNFEIKEYLDNFNKQSRRGVCIACLKEVTWSRERVAAHKRMNCGNATADEKQFFRKRKAGEMYHHNEDSFVDQSTTSNFATQFDAEQKQQADRLLALFFYRTGISFRLADSESFKAFVKKINPSYAETMPSSKMLSGSLLDQNYSSEAEKLNILLESSTNLTLISDGWTNVNGEHIVNYSVKAPRSKPLFKCSENTSGIVQTGKAIADAICKVITELGAEKFCCVVTDNASVMRAAWLEIEKRFPHISANGCAAHGLNLLIKDFLSVPVHEKTISESAKVIKFINNHHIVQAKFEKRRKEAKVQNKLNLPVPTRWFSHFNSLLNLHSAKYVLSKLCDEETAIIEEINPKTTSAAVLKLIKSNDFWHRITNCIKLIEYPTQLIGLYLKVFF